MRRALRKYHNAKGHYGLMKKGWGGNFRSPKLKRRRSGRNSRRNYRR